MQHCPLYDTNVPHFPVSSMYLILPTGPPVYHSHNNINNAPDNLLSPTPFPHQQYPFSLPTLKEPSTPSTPMYIPILTGRSDWCSWSEALMTAVMGMNLFSHIAESYDPQWGYDPGSVPTYPPTINHNSSPDDLQAWTLWWTRDGQVLHLLVSRLSPTVHAQLPGAGSSQP